ncbi:enoyl-[acyl-carrier-protein] reductase FabK [Pelotomaculum terephthalicicum JT]|uniref:enoyl-[acyl-carrier-protein] reductase FabK n=1 Tax=Pelotomaculum TaxID=191373 RepID=UPI0009CC8B26|nr:MULTISPECIES: enoyl-[acyl-carrier-protein] reductase FabK [Pelotomaculum]MCG9969770.1 enoyl-[acyl-carrier-protein] reductase FabK [Pelotomaculum terephthalicicum JT]OPX89927.1 MAG: Nitronate monooxygenase [Pelotomaculum sp. PtaB.Bin117]OPY62163.1 MAG: Nitronate monooxygenase [Pelotomaculum sp. PtaU1.Bin065]
MFRTALCDLLNIEYPIIQGGMARVSTAELAAAVSEAGGLGIIGSGTMPADWLRKQIRLARQLTKKPFGVNVMLLSPYLADIMLLLREEPVAVITTGAGNPGKYVPSLREVGTKVIPVVSSVALAKRLARTGVDALIAEGMESGGHIGDITTMAMVPQVVDVVDIPVIAAGGIFDGRGFVAALSLGAVGVQMGTRFMCASECTIHPKVKEAIIKAKDRDTTITGASLGHPVRSLRNKFTRKYKELEKQGITVDELEKFGVGSLAAAMVEGNVENGTVMAGQVCAMVGKIQTSRDIILETLQEAQQVIGNISRLVVKKT